MGSARAPEIFPSAIPTRAFIQWLVLRDFVQEQVADIDKC